MHPILVVDDEQAIAMLIRRILTDAGYRCEAVTDSIKAADLLEKKQYDLVLLDIMMPQISCDEFSYKSKDPYRDNK